MPAAQVPDPVEALRGDVAKARQLVDTDVQAATELLDRLAVQSLESRRVRTLSEAERPLHREVFLLRANVHLQMLNNDKVEESFRELLRIDPFFTGPLAPREQELMNTLRAREGGILDVSSSEANSKIVVNGVPAGLTGEQPTRLPLLAGEYEVRLEKEGFQPGTARVTIQTGQVVALRDLAPTRRVPPIAFLADREDVEMTVDGGAPVRLTRLAGLRSQLTSAESAAFDQAVTVAHLEGSGSGILLRDPPVDRPIVVRFRKECLVEETRTIAVTSESLAKLTGTEPLLWFGDASVVKLQPDVGTLRVQSTPADADVFVDGQVLGRTPFERTLCSGQHQVRVRHRIGSTSSSVTISRGRTEVVDTTLKLSLGFGGAVEAVQSGLRPAPDLTSEIERALPAVVTSYRVSSRIELPPDVLRWTDRSAADLVTAADRHDAAAILPLLKLASENFEAPLLAVAVRRSTAAGSELPVDLMLFWIDQAVPDVVRWTPPEDLRALLARFDAPADASEFVYRQDIGVRVADTSLKDVPLVVARVEPGSPAAQAGIKPGDSIESVDGAGTTAQQLAELVRQKHPGDVLALRVSTPGKPPRQVSLPIQRRSRQAPVFDPALLANAVVAKLNFATIVTKASADRDLFAFHTALAYMRLGDYKAAMTSLTSIGVLSEGIGIGPSAVLFYRARCHEALGEKDKALALYKTLSTVEDRSISDDGASVGAMARRRLASVGQPATPRAPARP
jgi:hypothetical protein